MEKTISSPSSRTRSHNRIDRNSKLFQTIIKAIQDKKGEHIVSLDLREIDEAVSDFFVICDAQTQIQMEAIISHVEDEVRKVCGEAPFHQERGPAWSLLDYVNVVLHVFQTEERDFYDLEGLWMDANKAEHEAA